MADENNINDRNHRLRAEPDQAERPNPAPRNIRTAVVSGDSDEGDIFNEHDEEASYRLNPNNPSTQDDLYDANLDDEDEAYVYKHMRGGMKESVSIIRQEVSNTNEDENLEQPKTKGTAQNVYKPRNSDAVLSCPCCFNIVCMDCQRHERYSNQFRAMFVMGVAVDWNLRLVYDDDQKVLVEKPQLPHQVPLDGYLNIGEDEYFSVGCASCRTQVAALDMKEEVYHFYGCLESS
jgi:3-phenylpropionate/cinnamic acid dioxygenase small subunit